MILEFLGLKRKPHYYEKDLENALIEHLHVNFCLSWAMVFHLWRGKKTFN